MATAKRAPKGEGKKLDEGVKLFIVQALACMDSPSQVAESVREEFGIEITRQHVAKYQPDHASGKNLAPKWREIYRETRAEFLKNSMSVPIANKSYRLRTLQKLLGQAIKIGNAPFVAQVLEQAAKEEGGAYTNRRELTGKDGKPMAMRLGTITRRVVDPKA